MTSQSDEAFFRIPVEVTGDADASRERAEWTSAECWEAGAAGIEERSREEGGLVLLIYVADSALEAVCRAAGLHGGRVGEAEALRAEDWSESWKRGLTAIEVSPRLAVRPSFAAFEPTPGQLELIVDPGQAFGTGGHASTRLALEWVDALAGELDAQTRVLDVGTGTGVLALAALGLGAGQAVAHDIDPLAAREAGHWAERNGLASGFLCFAGGLESLHAAPFDLVLANLLRRELLPLAPRLAELLSPSGRLVLSGLLALERPIVEQALAPLGLVTRGARTTRDAGEEWISLLMGRA